MTTHDDTVWLGCIFVNSRIMVKQWGAFLSSPRVEITWIPAAPRSQSDPLYTEGSFQRITLLSCCGVCASTLLPVLTSCWFVGMFVCSVCLPAGNCIHLTLRSYLPSELRLSVSVESQCLVCTLFWCPWPEVWQKWWRGTKQKHFLRWRWSREGTKSTRWLNLRKRKARVVSPASQHMLHFPVLT